MSEMRFNLKGPVGAIIGLLIVGGFVFFRFFMPFFATSQDKRAIIGKIKEINNAEVNRITKATVKHFKNTGKAIKTSDEIKGLVSDIKITDIEGKKKFLGGTKIKVTYTIDGKTPKHDGGVLFFRLYRRKQRRRSNRKITELSQITKDDFEK